jgi:fimbrial chaperone protein
MFGGVRTGRLAMVAALATIGAGGAACAQEVIQGLTVIPVTLELAPGQLTTVLTLENHTERETDFQVRPFGWDQLDGADRLTATDLLLVSPPLGRIAVGAGQVVRLVLRTPADGRESAYRILLDQVPPPPAPGQVSFALRLSIPVFVEPAAKVAAHVRWSVQAEGGTPYLVAVNSGGRHAVVHGLALSEAGGRALALESNVSPYILAGATRRWRILATSFAPSREALRLTAQADGGAIDQAVSVSSGGP